MRKGDEGLRAHKGGQDVDSQEEIEGSEYWDEEDEIINQIKAEEKLSKLYVYCNSVT